MVWGSVLLVFVLCVSVSSVSSPSPCGCLCVVGVLGRRRAGSLHSGQQGTPVSNHPLIYNSMKDRLWLHYGARLFHIARCLGLLFPCCSSVFSSAWSPVLLTSCATLVRECLAVVVCCPVPPPRSSSSATSPPSASSSCVSRPSCVFSLPSGHSKTLIVPPACVSACFWSRSELKPQQRATRTDSSCCWSPWKKREEEQQRRDPPPGPHKQ